MAHAATAITDARENAMFHKSLLKLFVVSCLLQAGSAMAVTLWNNGAPAVASPGGSNLSDTQQAQDFTLTSASSLTAVTFWSLEAAASDYVGSIFYQITNNQGGAPGTTVINFGTVTPTRTAAGVSAGFNQFQNDFVLPAVNLAAGTYWLTLHNGPLTTTAPLDFYWSWSDLNAINTPTARGREFLLNPLDTQWRTNDQEHAFFITGTAAIPEPTTWLLTGLGVATLAWRRRRSV
jgi:PEP-CTERM motif